MRDCQAVNHFSWHTSLGTPVSWDFNSREVFRCPLQIKVFAAPVRAQGVALGLPIKWMWSNNRLKQVDFIWLAACVMVNKCTDSLSEADRKTDADNPVWYVMYIYLLLDLPIWIITPFMPVSKKQLLVLKYTHPKKILSKFPAICTLKVISFRKYILNSSIRRSILSRLCAVAASVQYSNYGEEPLAAVYI